MIELVFGTTNLAKLDRISNILKSSQYNVIGLKKFGPLPDVAEDQPTVLGNARKKAIHFSKIISCPVLSMDTSLYLDNVDTNDQPALFVRRIKPENHSLTDEEMLQHYSNLFQKYGGKVTGRWHTAWVIAEPEGKISEVLVKSPPRYFIVTPSPKIVPGLPIDSLQIDPENGQYYSEMTPKQRDNVWGSVVSDALKDLLKKHFDN